MRSKQLETLNISKYGKNNKRKKIMALYIKPLLKPKNHKVKTFNLF